MRVRRGSYALAGALAVPLSFLVVAGCRREPPPAPDVVARVGGEEVRYSRFEDYLARSLGDPDAVLASDVLSELFDQFLDERLLARLAADRGLTHAVAADASGLATESRQARRAVDALLAAPAGGEPGAAEVAAYYGAHRGEFTHPERVRLRQILVEDRATAERARAEIVAGADFEQVARRLSQEPNAAHGGYQGVLSRADLPPTYADIIFALAPGEVSRVVPADYGFHLFQVLERLPEEVAPLAQVSPEIRDELRRAGADRRMTALVEEGRNRYNVEVYGRNLPFDYEGRYSESHSEKKPKPSPRR